jgi:glycosyltransferase involved in cell wall biosynthesis/peptidoglycan/xylan/chitin deacetylase (PgdA/CDA1 family)
VAVVPELSIVIPTYNRATRLRACLEALAQQTEPARDFEVIVVIDGSTDNTEEMISQISVPYSLHVLQQDNSGQNIARNRGVAAAKGRYCLFLDDDIMASPGLVAEHLRVQRQHHRVVGIGQITLSILPNADWYTRHFARGWAEHYERLNSRARLPEWTDCYGGNLSVSRAAFQEVGGFATDLPRSHDIELGYRLESAGIRVAYIPEAIGSQAESKEIHQYSQDAAKSGYAWIKLWQRHPGTGATVLGPYSETSLREDVLRRLLYTIGVPPKLLGQFGSVLSRYARDEKWFRFVSKYFYWRGIREAISDKQTWDSVMQGVPILMYHAVGGTGEPASRYIIPVNRFDRQMAWLKQKGCRVLHLEDYLEYRATHRLPPPRTVVITLDDGYADNRKLAYPILRQYGFPATLFPVSGKMGRINDWSRNELKARQLMTWEQLKEMVADGGVRIGAHTRTHALLPTMSVGDLRDEIAGSKEDLEHELGVPVTTFAYPYGEYDSAVLSVAAQANFTGACTVDEGLNFVGTSPMALRRIEIRGTYSLLQFALAVRFGYVPSVSVRNRTSYPRAREGQASTSPALSSNWSDQ